MIEQRECGCRTVFDGSGNVVSVGTCPQCLPCGAITWLIENGRQLELFGEQGVTPVVRRPEPDGSHRSLPSNTRSVFD